MVIKNEIDEKDFQEPSGTAFMHFQGKKSEYILFPSS